MPHLFGGLVQIFVCVFSRSFQQQGRNQERYGGRRNYTAEYRQQAAFWRHRDISEYTSRRRCSNQPRVKQREGKRSCHSPRDRGKDQARIHQNIREVNLVNASQEMDDRRSRRRLLCRAPADQPICEQDSKSGTRVGFKHKQNGFSRPRSLLQRDWLSTRD